MKFFLVIIGWVRGFLRNKLDKGVVNGRVGEEFFVIFWCSFNMDIIYLMYLGSFLFRIGVVGKIYM